MKPAWDVSLIPEYLWRAAFKVFFDICYTAPIAKSPLVDLDLITEYFPELRLHGITKPKSLKAWPRNVCVKILV